MAEKTIEDCQKMFYVYDVMGDYFDYNQLLNLPTINGITIKGDLTWEDLGLFWLTENEIKEICKL